MKSTISLIMCLALAFLSAGRGFADNTDQSVAVELSSGKGSYILRLMPGVTAEQVGDQLRIFPEDNAAVKAKPSVLLTVSPYDGEDVKPEEWQYIEIWTFNGDFENDMQSGQFKLKEGYEAYYVQKAWHEDDGSKSISMDCWYDIPGMKLYAQYEMPAAYREQYEEMFMNILKSVERP